jgi:hypothetical protein
MSRTTRPTHLVRDPGDRRSLCGIKNPLPVCAARHARAHRYPHDRCSACFEAAGLGDLLGRLWDEGS